MFMVWSQSATINDPWRCAAPSNWLGNRVERAKCLKKLQQGLQASTCLPQQGRGRGPALLVPVVSNMLRGVMHGLLRNSMSLVESACEWKVSSRGTVWLGACGRHDLNPKRAIHDLRVLQGRGNRTTNPDEAGSNSMASYCATCRAEDEYLRHR